MGDSTMPDESRASFEMTALSLLAYMVELDDADTVEVFNEDTHHMAVSFFYDDGAMDHSDDPFEHAHEWLCVVRVPTRYGYMEVPFNVSPSLAEALEAVVAEAAQP